MKFILGHKIGMSQLFDNDGTAVPVTVIEAGPCVVIQVKTQEKDGYEAVQLGFGTRRSKNIRKAQQGHFGTPGNFRHVKEFRIKELTEGALSPVRIGDQLAVKIFQEGDKVKISGISKGKGFQGVVKRHGFAGGPASHGNKDRLRAPGSIGTSFPEHVRKGRRMAGRMGFDRVTVKNLKVMKVDSEHNLLAVKGAIPGRKGTLLEISNV